MYVFLFKIVLFLVNYHECYFVFIEFEYYMKLFVWMMKTMVPKPPPPPPTPPPLILGRPGTDKILDFRGGGGGWGWHSIFLFYKKSELKMRVKCVVLKGQI